MALQIVPGCDYIAMTGEVVPINAGIEIIRHGYSDENPNASSSVGKRVSRGGIDAHHAAASVVTYAGHNQSRPERTRFE